MQQWQMRVPERNSKGDREGGKERGGEMERPKPHLVSWFATIIYPCWNKDCRPQPSSACLPLKPPPTRPVSHSHGWKGTTHTHTHGLLHVWEKNVAKEDGDGDDQWVVNDELWCSAGRSYLHTVMCITEQTDTSLKNKMLLWIKTVLQNNLSAQIPHSVSTIKHLKSASLIQY